MVPVAHPSTIQVVKKHHKWAGWHEISPEEFDACPRFSWWSIFSVTGMKFERALTKQQSKTEAQASYGGEYLARWNKLQNEFRKKVEEDKAALEQWREKRTGASASSSER